MRLVYNKLVRDRIPQIIQADGYLPVTRVLDADHYHTALREKLMEEAQEARQAPAAALPAELADVLEVLQALVAAAGMTWDELVAVAAAQRADRGGFDRRLFLEYVDQPS
jgi:predicted house-cleaning noncanonical NTP pyrophosphatase (MazG superfamily)